MLHVRRLSLLVLDLNMPEMDGVTVLRSIKVREEVKGVRVAMYSADTQDATKIEAWQPPVIRPANAPFHASLS